MVYVRNVLTSSISYTDYCLCLTLLHTLQGGKLKSPKRLSSKRVATAMKTTYSNRNIIPKHLFKYHLLTATHKIVTNTVPNKDIEV